MNRIEKTKELLRRTFRGSAEGTDLVGMDERILSDAFTNMRKAVVDNRQVHRISIWRTIMKSKVTSFSSAALMMIAVTIAVVHLGSSVDRSSVVFADVLRSIQEANSALWREQRIITCDDHEIDFWNSNVVRRFSSEYGSTEEMYTTDGWLMHHVYWLTQEDARIEVAPLFNQYKRAKLTEAERVVWSQANIEAAIEKFLKVEQPKKLGRKQIDGVEAEGFEFRDSEIAGAFVPVTFDSLVARLWVDVETSLPVRYEAELVISDRHITFFTGGKAVEVKVVGNEFQWNVEFEPETFEPNIPPYYTPMEY
ncbi:MAG: hypothetical protein CEE38_07590 [Planctomycetes bacterium B3_Pla]|nr:MAG: hypothetical protein CEE38_07590 [Planctomycetes bacterium B3_Pla]